MTGTPVSITPHRDQPPEADCSEPRADASDPRKGFHIPNRRFRLCLHLGRIPAKYAISIFRPFPQLLRCRSGSDLHERLKGELGAFPESELGRTQATCWTLDHCRNGNNPARQPANPEWFQLPDRRQVDSMGDDADFFGCRISDQEPSNKPADCVRRCCNVTSDSLARAN